VLLSAAVKRLTLLAATALAAVLTTVVSAQASGPYVSGSTGYDAAQGNCPATPPPASMGYSTFGVLNTTGGRPFTANTCLGQEISSAQAAGTAVSFYFNTGYVGAYGQDVTGGCNAAASAKGYTGKTAQAYAIGCSEFDYAYSQAGGVKGGMWWLDVETANSWSSANRSLNVNTIQGAIDEGHAVTGSWVGVYSSKSAWKTITGNAAVSADADWGLVNDYGWTCPGTAGFTGSPIWLLQGGTTSNGLDADTAC
jgi:hypothetical protein